MRVDWNERIGGIRLIEVRNFMRTVRGLIFHPNAVSNRLQIADEIGSVIFKALLVRGLIQPEAYGREGWYELSQTGSRFAANNCLPRISREKADRLVTEFLERVRATNEDKHVTHLVNEVRIFGSFLDTQAEDLGDIDIAIDLVLRYPNKPRYVLKRAAKLNLFTDCIYDAEDRCTRDIRRVLRARSPYFSITDFYGLKRIGATYRCFYKLECSANHPVSEADADTVSGR